MQRYRSSPPSPSSPLLLFLFFSATILHSSTGLFPAGGAVFTTCATAAVVLTAWRASVAGTCYVYPADARDPCRTKRCSYGAQCVPSLDGLTARCQCQDRCHSYGDSVGSTPLCGSDGTDYGNVCEMRRAACREMKDIEEKYEGKCDPCAHLDCPTGQVCRLDDGRRPVCRCNSTCPEEPSVVCGSDRITYKNECSLRAQSCLSGREIRLMSRGHCLPGSNRCLGVTCGPGESCQVDRTGKARCTCPTPCEKVVRPVCGTNGRTYDNPCELLRQSCVERTRIGVKYIGHCSIQSPCTHHKCQPEAVCAARGGEAVCECQHTCSEAFEPVCGSDGRSYTNECKLRAENCSRKANITINHKGLCSSCDETKCSFGEHCVDGKCTCQSNCPSAENEGQGGDDVIPLCGSDGINYPNECSLRLVACSQRVNIEIANAGRCQDILGYKDVAVEELCDGFAPLVNPSTGRRYDCNGGDEACPVGSYCHRMTTVAGCCREDTVQSKIKACQESKHGCCPDDPTVAALGQDGAGCPSVCQCNVLGSLFLTCDPVTRQCVCRPRVGGVRCDRCEPTYWGLAKIFDGQIGCVACGCNVYGSIREDCEQMTGKCACRPGFTGQKCSTCPGGTEVGFFGCSEPAIVRSALRQQTFSQGVQERQAGISAGPEKEENDIEVPFDGKSLNRNGPVAFDGKVHLRLENATGSMASQRSSKYEIVFRTSFRQGLLLLLLLRRRSKEDATVGAGGERGGGGGGGGVGGGRGGGGEERRVGGGRGGAAFVAVAINEGRIETSFSLGDGPSRLSIGARPETDVSDGERHTVSLARDGRMLTMAVDSSVPSLVVSAFSNPDVNQIDADDGSLWIGGYDGDLKALPTAYRMHFIGCVYSVRVKGILQNLLVPGSSDNKPLPGCES